MKTLLRRVFDPRMAALTRLSLTVAVSAAGLGCAAVIVDQELVRAALVALAILVGVGLPTYYGVLASRESRQEMRDLWGLSHVASDGRPWPAPGGWALGPDAIAFLLREISARGSRVVVELGPGSSSIILGRAIPDLEIYGVEHDEHFVRLVRQWVDLHGLSRYHLLHAPVSTQQVGGRSAQWYDPEVLQRLPQVIDVLVVDGPPNWKGSGNRAPAVPLLRDRLSDGGVVVVDDTYRPDERQMARRWMEEEGLDMVWDGGSFMVLEVPTSPASA